MTEQEIRSFVATLSTNAKLRFWARVSHQLTVIARDTYELGTEDVASPSRLRDANELQHRLTSVIVELADRREATIPDGVLVGFFLDGRADADWSGLLRFCLSSVLSKQQMDAPAQDEPKC